MKLGQEEIIVYTDGGCHGNPGVGGWAVIIVDNGKTIKLSGSDPYTTNNKMELIAVIKSLEELVKLDCLNKNITLYTDSQYVKNGITTWINNWKKNNWKTASKQPVKNMDLWLQLDELVGKCTISFCWVKGHSGNELNEVCDLLVQEAIKQSKNHNHFVK